VSDDLRIGSFLNLLFRNRDHGTCKDAKVTERKWLIPIVPHIHHIPEDRVDT